jgi:hypothetical protein
MNIDEELDLNTGKKKKFMIVGTPERIIANNKISYKIPIRLFNDNGKIKEQTSFINVSEEDMMSMLKMAKEMFADEEANKAYV